MRSAADIRNALAGTLVLLDDPHKPALERMPRFPTWLAVFRHEPGGRVARYRLRLDTPAGQHRGTGSSGIMECQVAVTERRLSGTTRLAFQLPGVRGPSGDILRLGTRMTPDHEEFGALVDRDSLYTVKQRTLADGLPELGEWAARSLPVREGEQTGRVTAWISANASAALLSFERGVALADPQPYARAERIGGIPLLAEVLLAHLVVCGLLEQREASGSLTEYRREYRIIPNVDTDMLQPVERTAVRLFRNWSTFGGFERALRTAREGPLATTNVMNSPSSHAPAAENRPPVSAASDLEVIETAIREAREIAPSAGCH
jgi:hypothetical protein